MKTIDVDAPDGTLADVADSALGDTVILTRGGKPIAAVVSLENSDDESVALSNNRRFLALIERSRSSYRRKGGVSADSLRSEFGLAPPDPETPGSP